MRFAGLMANNSFKPKLLRSGNGVAEKACHAVACATQFGLTQALGLHKTDPRLPSNCSSLLLRGQTDFVQRKRFPKPSDAG